MNLYEYVRSSPVVLVDPSGHGAAEKNAAIGAIDDEIKVHRDSLYYDDTLTALPALLGALKSALQALPADDFELDPDLGRAASWTAGFLGDTLSIGSLNPDSGGMVHEAVHVRNSQNNWHQGRADSALADDEGNAHGIQQMIAGLKPLRELESRVRAGRAVNDCKNIKGLWRTSWLSINSVVGFPWVSARQPGNVRVTDVWDIHAKHKRFRLSCSKLAPAYNKVIAGTIPEHLKHCCILECSQEALSLALHAPFK